MKCALSSVNLDYSDGILEWRSPVVTVRLSAWPFIIAQQKLLIGPWEACHISLPRTLLRSHPPGHRRLKRVAQLEQAAWEFTRRIPEEVRTVTRRYREQRWQVLKGLCYIEHGLQLAMANPALFWCLVEHLPSSTRQGTHLHQCSELLKQSQPEVAAFAGFPRTRGAVGILRKIPAESATAHSLSYLRELMRDEGIVKSLAPLPKVTDDIIAFYWFAKMFLEIRLATRLAAKLSPRHLRECVDLLRDLVHLHGELDIPVPIHPRLAGIGALEELHKSLLKRSSLASSGGNRRFPAPPLTGTNDVEPIADRAGLRREACEMAHCADSYTELVTHGRCFIYRVLRPQRATLRMERTAEGGWRIAELKLKANREPSPDTWRAVQHWLYLQTPIEGEGEREESERTAENHDECR